MSRDDEFRRLAEKRASLERERHEAVQRESEFRRERERFEEQIRAADQELGKFLGNNIPVRQTVVNGKLVRAVLLAAGDAIVKPAIRVTIEDIL